MHPGIKSAHDAIAQLKACEPHLWADLFVKLYMQFHRMYGQGYITSTSHGVDFFDNVVAGPEAWKEKGIYGDNFRKMLKGLQ